MVALLIFSLAHATSNVLLSPRDLAKDGWDMTQQNGITVAKSREHGWKKVFSSKDKFAVSYVTFGDDGRAENWDHLQTTADGFRVESNTHCYPPGQSDTKETKPTCRTVTADYCRSLAQLSDSQVFRSDISKLNECGRILEKVDFNGKDVEEKHKVGMARIYTHLQKTPDAFTHATGKPKSLFDVTSDYHACKTYEGKWAPATSSSPGGSTGAAR